jgi:chromosome segregation ATPase
VTEIITTKNSPLKHDNRGVDYYLVLNASLADKNMYLTKKIENTEESLMVSSQTIETLRSCVQNMDSIIVKNSRHRLWLEEQLESIRISFQIQTNYFENRIKTLQDVNNYFDNQADENEYKNYIENIKTTIRQYENEIEQLTQVKETYRKTIIIPLQIEIRRLKTVERSNLSTIKDLNMSTQKFELEIQGLSIVEESNQQVIGRLQKSINQSDSEVKNLQDQIDHIELQCLENKKTIENLNNNIQITKRDIEGLENTQIDTNIKLKRNQMKEKSNREEIQLLTNRIDQSQSIIENHKSEVEKMKNKEISIVSLLKEKQLLLQQLEIDMIDLTTEIEKKNTTIIEVNNNYKEEIKIAEEYNIELEKRIKNLQNEKESKRNIITTLESQVEEKEVREMVNKIQKSIPSMISQKMSSIFQPKTTLLQITKRK